ncbi:hypothetical protein EIP91_002405 [Steccherinum ochraceum]|uniref:Uncharacterized protein n=1 Tax=Steccherinum ochraceum TaxID=92696 RepID=A0A4V2MWB9_9APHY|nr:hypothetical protein EIP91_002405 [Steccherinum ochraceum]
MIHPLEGNPQTLDTSDANLSLSPSRLTSSPLPHKAALPLPFHPRRQDVSRTLRYCFPIEVWERILDLIEDCYSLKEFRSFSATLAACCSVCKALFPRSRYLLHQNIKIVLASAKQLERFVRSLKALPSLCEQVKDIAIDVDQSSGRNHQSWVPCALLQLSTFKFGAWLCLWLDGVDMQMLNPLALRGWTSRRLKQVYLDNVHFSRFSQLQPFLSIAEEVQFARLSLGDFVTPYHFGTLIAPPHHALCNLTLEGDRLAAAMLTNTSWFKSSIQLVKFTVNGYAGNVEKNIPHVVAIVRRALELYNRSRLLTVQLAGSLRWDIRLDPNGTLDVELWQKDLEDLIPCLMAIFRTISPTRAMHTLRLELQVYLNSEELQLNWLRRQWEALDDALASPANDSIQRYEFKVSRAYMVRDPSELVPRRYPCMNDVIQVLLPKFTSNRAPVDLRCTSCILHKRGPPAAESKDSRRTARKAVAARAKVAAKTMMN